MIKTTSLLKRAGGGLAVLLLLAATAGDHHDLFTGSSLDGWRAPTGEWQAVKNVALGMADARKIVLTPGEGILANGVQGKTVNLITTEEFGDIEAHVEFFLPAKSNSGIYFMGRYEVQIFDSESLAKVPYSGIECGGLYPRWDEAKQKEYEGHSPRVPAAKPPGLWQTFDLVFRAPRFDATGKKTANAKFVKVTLNGKVIHENVEITGPTRAAQYDDERPTGPLMLQGDHGPVSFRNLWVKRVP